MAKKTIYICDINTCEAEFEDPTKVQEVQILDKCYDVCEQCYASLSRFIEKRLNEGRIEGEKKQSMEDFIKILKKFGSQKQLSPIGLLPNSQPTGIFGLQQITASDLGNPNIIYTLCADVKEMME